MPSQSFKTAGAVTLFLSSISVVHYAVNHVTGPTEEDMMQTHRSLKVKNFSQLFTDPKSTSIRTTSTGLFDKMNAHLYDVATNLPVDVLPARNEFTLGAVPTTEGGLKDSDRILLASLYSKADSVFEFGLGESTTIANYVGVPRYTGVDSDALYVANSRENTNPNYRFYFADVGKTGMWGWGEDETLRKGAFNYQSAPLNNELDPFDVYLVDGRYRVACVCASFLHAMSRGGDLSRIRVGMHDFAREYYHVVLEFADLVTISESGRLAILSLKPEATQEQIFSMWESNIGNSE